MENQDSVVQEASPMELSESRSVTVTRNVFPGTQLKQRGIDLPITECPTNLDLRNPAHRAMAFNAGNPSDYKLNGAEPIYFRAVAYLVMPDERTDPETGEISAFERLILFNKKGETFRTSSAFGWRRAKAAVELFSPDEWAMGICFVIRARMGESKRWYHDIRVKVDREDGDGPEPE